MSLSQLWPKLATIQAEHDGSSVVWKVLYASRRQPLLVPLDIRHARRAISFFIRSPLLRHWGNLMLTLDRRLPRAHLLPIVRLENFPCSTLFGPNESSHITLFFGFPGPLQKVTLHCPDSNPGPGMVAKLALNKTADNAIYQEAQWLSKFSHLPLIARFTPRFLLQGSLPCGRHYFSMGALPQSISRRQFGKPHYDFLQTLASQTQVTGLWKDSPAYMRLHQRAKYAMPLVDDALGQLWTDILTEIEQRIGHQVLPSCMTHGDFAPWNLRQTSTQLFVFDWEYAEAGGNPLQDFLHFHLIQHALRRWPFGSVTISELLHKAGAYAESQFDSSLKYASGALTLHYLLDTMTFYVSVSGHMDYAHPVLKAYLKLLQQRSQWLPKVQQNSTKQSPQYAAPGY